MVATAKHCTCLQSRLHNPGALHCVRQPQLMQTRPCTQQPTVLLSAVPQLMHACTCVRVACACPADGQSPTLQPCTEHTSPSSSRHGHARELLHMIALSAARQPKHACTCVRDSRVACVCQAVDAAPQSTLEPCNVCSECPSAHLAQRKSGPTAGTPDWDNTMCLMHRSPRL